MTARPRPLDPAAARTCVEPGCLAVVVYRTGLVGRPPTRCRAHGGTADRVLGEVADKDVAADAWLRENDLAPSRTLADYRDEVTRR